MTPKPNSDFVTQGSQIVVYDNDHPMAVFPLQHPPLRIGRAAHQVDIWLNDPTVSRVHAIIEHTDGALWVTDCSSYGTLLGQERLRHGYRTLWVPDTSLTIGPFTLHYTASPARHSGLWLIPPGQFALFGVHGPRAGTVWQAGQATVTVGGVQPANLYLPECAGTAVTIERVCGRVLLTPVQGDALLRQDGTDVMLTGPTPWTEREWLRLGPHTFRLLHIAPKATQVPLQTFGPMVAGSKRRAQVLAELANWVITPDPPVLWLSGPAGSGKSLAAQTAHGYGEDYGTPIEHVYVELLASDSDAQHLGSTASEQRMLVIDGTDNIPNKLLDSCINNHGIHEHLRLIVLSTAPPPTSIQAQVLHLALPSLASTPEDIPVIAQAILQEHFGDVSLSNDAVEWLTARTWQGDVRELAALVCAASRIARPRPGGVLTAHDLRGHEGGTAWFHTKAQRQAADALMYTGKIMTAAKYLDWSHERLTLTLRRTPWAVWGTPFSSRNVSS